MLLKDRFSNVQRYAPTASRNASSETYLICRNKLPRARKRANGRTAMEQVSDHLKNIGIVTNRNDPEEEVATLVGLRKLSRRE